jgi:hypothetical protein
LKKIRKENPAKYMIVDGEVVKVDLVGQPATGDLFLEQRSEEAPESDTESTSRPMRPMPLSEYKKRKAEATGVSETTIGADLDAIDRAVPDKDADEKTKRKSQKARAKKYGIEALDGKGENLSYQKGDPTTELLYGDPTNLKYPLGYDDNKVSLKRANNARARFKQAHETYSKDKSKKQIHTRIVKAQLKAGASPKYNPDDPLDAMLPKSLTKKMDGGDASDRTTGTEETNMPATMEEFMLKLGGVVENLATTVNNVNSAVERMNDALPSENEGETEDDNSTDEGSERNEEPPAEATQSAQGETEEDSGTTSPENPEDVPEDVSERETPAPEDVPSPTAGIQVSDQLMSTMDRMTDSLTSMRGTIEGMDGKIDRLGSRVTDLEGDSTTSNGEGEDETTPVEEKRSESQWGSLGLLS